MKYKTQPSRNSPCFTLLQKIQLASNQVWGICWFSFMIGYSWVDNMLASSFHTCNSLKLSVRFDKALFIFCFWLLVFVALDYWVLSFLGDFVFLIYFGFVNFQFIFNFTFLRFCCDACKSFLTQKSLGNLPFLRLMFRAK